MRRSDRARFPPGGIDGGGAGAPSRFIIRYGAPDQEETPAAGRFELKAGARFSLQGAGGGGYGDPQTRDRDAVARDIAEGYVTREAAARDYGWRQSAREKGE